MTVTILSAKESRSLTAASTRRVVLDLGSAMSFDDWAAVGKRIALIHGAAAWALGDWLLYGERRFGARYRSAVDATNLDYQTLRNYAWVARSFTPARRRDRLSFQHHAEVASLPAAEQDLWLHRAEAQAWSRNQLRRCISEHRLTRKVQWRKPPTVVRVEVARERAERWRAAASAAEHELPEWLLMVADEAADASLSCDL